MNPIKGKFDDLQADDQQLKGTVDANGFSLENNKDSSLPLPAGGSTVFINDINASTFISPGSIGVDIFRHDTNNVYGTPDMYAEYGLIDTPIEVFPPHKHNPKLPAYYLMSKTLGTPVFFEKHGPTKQPPLSANNGLDFNHLSKTETYDFYVWPSLYKDLYNAGDVPEFSTYMENIFAQGGSFLHNNFSMDLVNYRQNDATAAPQSFVNVTTHYNYYQQNYEEVIEEANTLLLPNLYGYMVTLEDNYDILEANEELYKLNGSQFLNAKVMSSHATLNYTVGVDASMTGGGETGPNGSNASVDFIRKGPLSRYLTEWSEAYLGLSSMDDGVMFNTFLDNYKNFIISDSLKANLGVYNQRARNFPMHVNIDFSTDPNKEFANILRDTKTDMLLLNWMRKTGPTESEKFVEFEGNSYYSNLNRQTWDLEAFLTDIIDGGFTVDEKPDDYIFLGTSDEQAEALYNNNTLGAQINTAALKAKVEKFISQKIPQYTDILYGNLCYNETFCYEVEKMAGTKAVAPPSDLGISYADDNIQTFYFPNDNLPVMQFVDTQVKYNTKYYYRIWKWQVVVAADYTPIAEGVVNSPNEAGFHSYGIHPLAGDGAPTAILDDGLVVPISDDIGPEYQVVRTKVRIRPRVKIVRVPYYNVVDEPYTNATDTFILDDPPLPPEIEIVPIIGEPTTILINLKDTIGSHKAFAKIINPSVGETAADPDHVFGDDFFFSSVLTAQARNNLTLSPSDLNNINIDNTKVLFTSDDISESFEIYATPYKPSEYSDFSQYLAAEIPGPNNVFKTELDFNTKYYFTFRATDRHGNMSNPTPVYEVELKENSGAVYPIINVLDLDEELLKKQEEMREHRTSVSGRMFLYIKPTEEQTTLLGSFDEDAETAPEALPISLGDVEGSSVFGKQFKVRIKSKKTGKILDINFNCDNNMQNSFTQEGDNFGE